MGIKSLPINAAFKIEAYKPQASTMEIESLLSSAGVTIPDIYLRIVREMTDVEILVNQQKYVRIWGPARVLEMNEAYEVQKNIPTSLAIGDDEGGSALILMAGDHGFGLYKVGFGDLDVDDASYIAPSLEEFLINAIGIEAI
ncbi:hypothetical protein AAFN46_03775 [Pseudomonas sp. CAU 1711]|uniref:hypothetical protein n=1 Tax=Pseudomonas sp. CAU 1711 TaxID=3140356 RepID=UPI00326150E0